MWFELHRDELERAYLRLEKPMFNVVYRWVWSTSDAQEIVQEAFLKVWNARARVDVTTLEPLLYRTALNLASNRRRALRVRRWMGLEAADDEPAKTRSPEDALTAKRVRAAIDALPARLREIVMLSEIAEMSYGEIADTLGIPIGTVGSRRNTALARLAETLGALE